MGSVLTATLRPRLTPTVTVATILTILVPTRTAESLLAAGGEDGDGDGVAVTTVTLTTVIVAAMDVAGAVAMDTTEEVAMAIEEADTLQAASAVGVAEAGDAKVRTAS